MDTIRRIHLYLGCIFAPLLIFFAVSGIWQTLHLQHDSYALRLLSTVHMSHPLKTARHPDTLSSPTLQWTVIAMAVSLVVSVLLGVVMAFRFGHRATALICLALGFLFPFILVVLRFVM